MQTPSLLPVELPRLEHLPPGEHLLLVCTFVQLDDQPSILRNQSIWLRYQILSPKSLMKTKSSARATQAPVFLRSGIRVRQVKHFRWHI